MPLDEGDYYFMLRARIEGLELELADAIKQRDEARLDAERYKWLKSAACYWVGIQSQPSGDYIFHGRGSCVMDAAIDAAIATQKEGGGA